MTAQPDPRHIALVQDILGRVGTLEDHRNTMQREYVQLNSLVTHVQGESARSMAGHQANQTSIFEINMKLELISQKCDFVNAAVIRLEQNIIDGKGRGKGGGGGGWNCFVDQKNTKIPMYDGTPKGIEFTTWASRLKGRTREQ